MAPSGDVPFESGSSGRDLVPIEDDTALLQPEATLLEGEPALGRDPFAETVAIDPFLERLEELGGRGRRARPAGPRAKPRPRLPRPVAVRPHHVATPPLAESAIARFQRTCSSSYWSRQRSSAAKVRSG